MDWTCPLEGFREVKGIQKRNPTPDLWPVLGMGNSSGPAVSSWVTDGVTVGHAGQRQRPVSNHYHYHGHMGQWKDREAKTRPGQVGASTRCKEEFKGQQGSCATLKQDSLRKFSQGQEETETGRMTEPVRTARVPEMHNSWLQTAEKWELLLCFVLFSGRTLHCLLLSDR